MIDCGADIAWDELTLRLREFVSRRIPGADVDDVLQEGLVRIHQGLPRLRDSDRLGPWVYRVTRSAIADHLRARARAAPPDDPEPADEPTDVAMMDALAGCLSAFVAELPSPYREAITLTELEGLSQKEAAEMLGISVSGMKSRVQRGRDRLRQRFDRCCKLTLDARGRVISCEPRSGCR